MANNFYSSPVSIYALGGLGEVGKNTYCIENEKTLIMIDAGVRFPDADMPGVDYIIPDYTHLKNNRHKLKALVITHGHEDHIGGIPFLVQSVHIPVIYAPRLAAAFIKHKLEDNRIREPVKIVEYDEDRVIRIDDFVISFFSVTHSIPDSFGICIDTPEGRIVTTGDFKIDLTPIGADINLGKIAKLGSEGVDLLLSDSTNAEIEGYTPSERNIIGAINEIFKNTYGRLIISTFSSNISRIQQIVEVAVNFKRKIAIVGRSMENAISLSRAMGIIKIPDTSIVMIEDIRSLRPEETLILCTGSQGEPMAALSRIANNEHRSVKIIPGDTVVFSSSPIPGNGLSIRKVVNQLTRMGASVLTNSILYNVHSSGHPARQELRFMLKLVKPRYFMPMHGEYRMLKLHTEIAQSLGMPKDNTFICANGDILLLQRGVVRRGNYTVPAEHIYIDGRDITGLTANVIQDRKTFSEDGIVSALIAYNQQENKLISRPKITSYGFIYQNSGPLITKAENRLMEDLEKLLLRKVSLGEIKQTVIESLRHYINIKTERTPMIVPVIMTQNN